MQFRPRSTLAALTLLPAAMLAPGVGAAVATDPPPVTTVGIASPSDDGPHPGSYTEWWYSALSDPATGRNLIVQFVTNPVPVVNTFWYDGNGTKMHWTWPITDVTTSNQPSVCSSAGCLTFDTSTQRYHLTFSANGASGDVWFNSAKPGPKTVDPIVFDGQTNYWANPVMTSTLSGWIWLGYQPLPTSVDSWRGYHDHNWGSFDLSNQTTTGWEWGVSHLPDGNAQVMGGNIDGNGRWQGIVANTSSTGTKACTSDSLLSASALQLSNWSTTQTLGKPAGGFAYPRSVKVVCTTGGAGVQTPTYTVTDPYYIDEEAAGFGFTESVGRTTTGSGGLIEHSRSVSHFGS